jgi:LexA-binding, inner membrane-associated putative hydrolase
MTPGGHAGASILAAYIVERCAFGNEVTPLVLGLSAIVGLLPDLDGLVTMVVKRQKPSQQKLRHHQFWSHTPLFYVGLTLLLALVTSGQNALLFGMLALLHLVLDSWSTDDGIMWLWPLSHRQLALFPRNLHAGGAFGMRFYRLHVRCAQVMVPEVLFVASGVFLAFRTLSIV